MDSLIADETMEVPVYEIPLRGNTPFDKLYVATVSVKEHAVDMYNVKLLTVNQKLLCIHGESNESRVSVLANELSNKKKQKRWQEVVDAAYET